MNGRTDLNGIWHNPYGSEMTLEVDKTGRISGKFRTGVGRVETKKDWDGSWFDLVGFSNGDLVSFVVHFNSTGAMCSVIGRLVSNSNGMTPQRIETLSYTSFNMPEEDHWKATVAAAVVYERGPVIT